MELEWRPCDPHKAKGARPRRLQTSSKQTEPRQPFGPSCKNSALKPAEETLTPFLSVAKEAKRSRAEPNTSSPRTRPSPASFARRDPVTTVVASRTPHAAARSWRLSRCALSLPAQSFSIFLGFGWPKLSQVGAPQPRAKVAPPPLGLA